MGLQGLELLKDHFKLFKKLKVLKMASCKLFLMPDRRTEVLRDLLNEVTSTLEELNLSENAMEKTDFDLIMPVIARMPNLRILTCNVNRVWGPSIRAFLDLYI
jgi:hypothetical protein